MSSLKDLLIEESIIKSRLEKCIENGKKTALARRNQGFFEAKIADLKNLWEKYTDADLQIMKQLQANQSTEQHEYIAQDNFATTEAKYSEYMGDLLEGRRKCTVPTSSASDSPVQTTVTQHDTTLPRITLPKFNGEYNCWRSFHDLFVSLIHTNGKLSSVQKLHYLKTCLTDDAERILRHTPVTDNDYEPAWTKLKQRYENKRILINHQLHNLVNQQKIHTETSKGLKSLIDTTDECLQQLKSLDVDTASWNCLLIYIIVQKLPFITLKLWEEELGSTKEMPTFEEFKSFLNTRLKVLESISDAVNSKNTQSKYNNKEKTQTYHAVRQGKCPACGGKHFIPKCSKYKEMSVQARRKTILQSGRCLNCLSSNHSSSECTSKHCCFKCSKRHHTSLHVDDGKNQSTTIPKQSTDITPSQTNQKQEHNNHTADGLHTTQTFITSQHTQALLSTAIITARSRHGVPSTLRCLIDPGSQSSFLTEAACQKLGAVCTPTSMAITGLGASVAASSHKQTTLQLQGRNSEGPVIAETFLILKRITDPLPKRNLSKKDFEHIKDLQLADSTYWKSGKIDALLGASVYARIIKEGIRRGSDSAPIAISTLFGWILLGPTSTSSQDNTHAFSVTTENDLLIQLKRFWEIEEFPINPILKQEEEECQVLYRDSHTRLTNGQYQVNLPFKNNEIPVLGESRPQALRRFQALQTQFKRKPDMAADYIKCLNEYLELGHMEMIKPATNDIPNYYIPHHAVFKDSSTTKLRVVFDASCKTTNGQALNDYLLKGPTLQPKLFATLLNWRKYKIAINADIEKMYRMIFVHPSQRTFQRIIWQHPITKEPQDYQLNTVTFGTTSAPYLAIRTLQQLAEDERERYPLASKAVFKNFYVDDVLAGAENVTSAQVLQTELLEMMKSGGFNLRKWASNDANLLSNIPKEHRELKESLRVGNEDVIKTLGIQWHPNSDHFTFKYSPKKQHQTTSKRTILSEIASLYDPLGWLAPTVVIAKLLIQELWITGCSWDTSVSEKIELQWINFKKDLLNLPQLKIPRWIHYKANISLQVHGFCDASSKAYAAVVYLRTEDEEGHITSMLLTAKTKVSPIKPTTIPRLELNGAVLLARLLQATIKDMDLHNVPIYAWTDSTIVLQWIREHPSRWKTYVANRVVEIQEVIKYDSWNHVPTADNPADLASRGRNVSELINSEIWWYGPTWLSKDQDKWPQLQKTEDVTDLEAKQQTTTTFAIEVDDDILFRYSSFTKLVVTVATILRVPHNMLNRLSKRTGYVSADEWRNAEGIILRLVQQTAFAEDYQNLKNSKLLSNKSKLRQLNPYIDERGLIRMRGRLQNANIPSARKCPIILPKNHHVTSLIIDKIHKETLHGGPSLVLASSRDKYWILDARRCITSIIHKCVICTRHRKSIMTQLMGNLPDTRVNISRPFSKVGIDFAGPVTIKASLCRKAKLLKAYICIFVCMATKATHIELVSGLTSDAFIAALKRFVARRGLCTDIFSDCGTNFVGAKSLLDKDVKRAIAEATPEAAQFFSSKTITWHFNPPASPHFGGLWESGVKSIKYHLRRSLGNTTCTFEEYATILAQIEACLNSRPLCYVTNDPEDTTILTPGHFLIGEALNAIPEPDKCKIKVPLSQRWAFIQQKTREFWNKWSKDYLNQLQNRPKWLTQQKNLQVGDIVLIKNENSPPVVWPLAVVEKLYPGTDGLIRVVQVRTQHNSLLRPISKICPLPIEQASETRTNTSCS